MYVKPTFSGTASLRYQIWIRKNRIILEQDEKLQNIELKDFYLKLKLVY